MEEKAIMEVEELETINSKIYNVIKKLAKIQNENPEADYYFVLSKNLDGLKQCAKLLDKFDRPLAVKKELEKVFDAMGDKPLVYIINKVQQMGMEQISERAFLGASRANIIFNTLIMYSTLYALLRYEDVERRLDEQNANRSRISG